MELKIKPIVFTYDVSGLDRVEAILEQRFIKIVEKAANDIKALSQYYVPVDQGVAKASHFVVTQTGSDRDEAIALAQQEAALQPSRYGHQGRQVSFDSEEADLRAYHAFICVAVSYAMELEFGYISGSLNVRAENPGAQRPFLTPAVIEYEESFIKACVAAFGNL